MSILLPLGTAFVLGLIHAIDVDHAVAVSTFVAGRPALRTAIGYGVRWGAGHSVAVLAAGSLVLALGLRIDPRFDQWAESAVGVMLIALGLLALRSLRNLHLHGPPAHGDHAHLHVHGQAPTKHEHGHPTPREAHHHPRRPMLVGLLHGLAGTSGALAIVPVTLLSSWQAGLAYLVAFCVGVTSGMVLFALGLAEALRRTSARSLSWGRRIGQLIALVSIITGAYWISSSLGLAG
jgi:cytochrome c biogenesis protein CcdA